MLAVTLGSVSTTTAAYTDTAVVTTGVIHADSVRSPNSVECVSSGLLSPLVFAWTNPDARYDFLVTLEQPAGVVRETRRIANNGAPGTLQTTNYAPALLESLIGINVGVTVRVRSYLASAQTWVSSPGVTDTGRATSVVGLGLMTSCS